MRDYTVLIEQTSKRWKKLRLIALGLIIVGFTIMISTGSSIGGLFFMPGFAVYGYARFMGWWYHG